jgi:hypothetical protein
MLLRVSEAWFVVGKLPERLKPIEKVVPVLGAGTGFDAGLPNGKDLADVLAELGDLPAELPGRGDLFTVVDELTAAAGRGTDCSGRSPTTLRGSRSRRRRSSTGLSVCGRG